MLTSTVKDGILVKIQPYEVTIYVRFFVLWFRT